jgi:hypothetical protein
MIFLSSACLKDKNAICDNYRGKLRKKGIKRGRKEKNKETTEQKENDTYYYEYFL